MLVRSTSVKLAAAAWLTALDLYTSSTSLNMFACIHSRWDLDPHLVVDTHAGCQVLIGGASAVKGVANRCKDVVVLPQGFPAGVAKALGPTLRLDVKRREEAAHALHTSTQAMNKGITSHDTPDMLQNGADLCIATATCGATRVETSWLDLFWSSTTADVAHWQLPCPHVHA